jgi:integrase
MMPVTYMLRQHAALPFTQWPEGDRNAWSAALQPKGFRKKGGKGSEWRPTSRRSLIGVYGRWLKWLQTQDIDLATEAPADRLTEQSVDAYALYLDTGCASVTVHSYLGQLYMAVIAMFPIKDWSWLRAIHRDYKQRASPSRIKSFAPVDEVYQLGLDLIARSGPLLDRAKNSSMSERQFMAPARDYRDGLIIALLASRPLRIKNLAEMEIGKHLRQKGDWMTIDFMARETKTDKALHASWPEPLKAALQRYRDDVRPRLIAASPTGGNSRPAGQPGARLWVGQGGTWLSHAGINLALERHTRRRFGYAMTAHRFRDSVATSIANDDPTKVQIASQILGHSTIAMTERHYIVQNNEVALALHHDRIAAMRKAAKKELKRQAGRL